MREIEFRAWDDTRKEMISRVPVMNGLAMTWRVAPKDSPVITLDGIDGLQNFYCDWDFLKEEPSLKLMQYTGLKDINCTKIFEGDIVYVPGIGNAEVVIDPHLGTSYRHNYLGRKELDSYLDS